MAKDSSKSFKANAYYWAPSIVTGTVLLTSFIWLSPLYPSFYTNPDDNLDETSHNFYNDYVSRVPVFLLESLFLATLVSNAMFGRRPDNDDNHQSATNDALQGAAEVVPIALGFIHRVGTAIEDVVSTTQFGGVIKASNRLIARAGAVADFTLRGAAVIEDLYDHDVDRTLYTIGEHGVRTSKGEMRYTERLASRAEHIITYTVEAGVYYLYIAAESGMIKRIAVNDANRLLMIAAIFKVADFLTDEILIPPVNEGAYYAARWANTQPLEFLLNALGIADSDPEHMVIGVEIRDSEVQAAQAARRAAIIRKSIADHAEDVGDAIADGTHDVLNKFRGWFGIKLKPNDLPPADNHDVQQDADDHKVTQANNAAQGTTQYLFGFIGGIFHRGTYKQDPTHAVVHDEDANNQLPIPNLAGNIRTEIDPDGTTHIRITHGADQQAQPNGVHIPEEVHITIHPNGATNIHITNHHNQAQHPGLIPQFHIDILPNGAVRTHTGDNEGNAVVAAGMPHLHHEEDEHGGVLHNLAHALHLDRHNRGQLQVEEVSDHGDEEKEDDSDDDVDDDEHHVEEIHTTTPAQAYKKKGLLYRLTHPFYKDASSSSNTDKGDNSKGGTSSKDGKKHASNTEEGIQDASDSFISKNSQSKEVNLNPINKLAYKEVISKERQEYNESMRALKESLEEKLAHTSHYKSTEAPIKLDEGQTWVSLPFLLTSDPISFVGSGSGEDLFHTPQPIYM